VVVDDRLRRAEADAVVPWPRLKLRLQSCTPRSPFIPTPSLFSLPALAHGDRMTTSTSLTQPSPPLVCSYPRQPTH
jgi:hypothetical protein